MHFHFIPTRSSWLNQIETWFSILQGQSLNGASFTSVEQLQEHIDAFISTYNETATHSHGPRRGSTSGGLKIAVSPSCNFGY